MKKQLLITTIGVITVGALMTGSSLAFAQSGNGNRESLVNRIATRFSLNESDVQTVFDESRAEFQAKRQAEMSTALENRLNQAVTDGKITAEQKQLIIAKHEELQKTHEADRDEWQSKTAEERRAAMESRRTELETWASANNIDISYFPGGTGGMMGKGDGMGMGGGRHGGMAEGRFGN